MCRFGFYFIFRLLHFGLAPGLGDDRTDQLDLLKSVFILLLQHGLDALLGLLVGVDGISFKRERCHLAFRTLCKCVILIKFNYF